MSNPEHLQSVYLNDPKTIRVGDVIRREAGDDEYILSYFQHRQGEYKGVYSYDYYLVLICLSSGVFYDHPVRVTCLPGDLTKLEDYEIEPRALGFTFNYTLVRRAVR